ncbi:hypothetical protein F4604DRAFT_1764251 [Suillus subluteus]|nr:hypothetical protein F4604DRAFT_1764251 [Suillus subluteus]
MQSYMQLFLVLADVTALTNIVTWPGLVPRPANMPPVHSFTVPVKSTHYNVPTVRDKSFTRLQMTDGTSGIRRHEGVRNQTMC